MIVKEIRWFLTGLLFLFVALKLTSHIDWSWLWVLAPFWIPLVISAVGLALEGIAWLGMSEDERKRRELAQAFRSYGDALCRNRR